MRVIMALSKLLYKEKVRQEAIEDVFGYGARSLGYFELKAEQENNFKLHPPSSRRSSALVVHQLLCQLLFDIGQVTT